MKSINVCTGIASEVIKEFDNKLATELSALYLAIGQDKDKLVKKLKAIAFSYGLKSVISSLTDNSVINQVMDINFGIQLFLGAMQVGSTIKKASTFSAEDVKAEIERLEKIEFDLEF